MVKLVAKEDDPLAVTGQLAPQRSAQLAAWRACSAAVKLAVRLFWGPMQLALESQPLCFAQLAV